MEEVREGVREGHRAMRERERERGRWGGIKGEREREEGGEIGEERGREERERGMEVGRECYTSKFISPIMSHYHYHKCRKCLTFFTSVVNVTFSFCICHIAKNTMETLDTSSKTC
jgi:hypothetical protein